MKLLSQTVALLAGQGMRYNIAEPSITTVEIVFLIHLDDTSFCNTFFETDFASVTFISPDSENIAVGTGDNS